MLDDLLWKLYSNDVRTGVSQRSQRVYRAPSWSWASIDGRVRALGRDISSHEILAAVKSTKVNLVDPENQFGSILSGTKLTLSGCLFPLELSWNLYFPDDSDVFDILYFRLSFEHSKATRSSAYVWMDVPHFDMPRRDNLGLYLFLIYSEDGRRRLERGRGLVLTNFGLPQGYRRIGYFETFLTTRPLRQHG